MGKVDEAVECFCRGAACSQAIVATYGEALGLSPELGLKLASGFAGGMRLGETCGAVTGAFMILGLKYAGPNCETLDGRTDVYEAMQDFVAEFKRCNQTIVCKDLLGCDAGTPAGSAKATQEGLFRTICPRLVRNAAEILERML